MTVITCFYSWLNEPHLEGRVDQTRYSSGSTVVQGVILCRIKLVRQWHLIVYGIKYEAN